MTPEDRLIRVERQVDGLLASFGDMTKTLVEHTERIRAATEDRRRLADAGQAAREDTLAAIGRVEERLTRRIAEVDANCRAFAAEYRDDRQRARLSNRTVVLTVLAGSFAVLASVAGSLIVVLGG